MVVCAGVEGENTTATRISQHSTQIYSRKYIPGKHAVRNVLALFITHAMDKYRREVVCIKVPKNFGEVTYALSVSFRLIHSLAIANE